MKHFFRYFIFSALVTTGTLVAVLVGLGPGAVVVTVLLVLIEITFSFENAVINAETLQALSSRWQTLFLTVGIIVAIFGMRIVFPILIVAFTAHLPWHQVADLALHEPAQYAEKLELAHPAIASFGGAFLLMLSLQFFFDQTRSVRWIERIERPLQRLKHPWLPVIFSVVVVLLLAALPMNQHAGETLRAGLAGIVTYVTVQLIEGLFEQFRGKSVHGHVVQRTGWAAVMTFVYLEILDASFSFDGVIGAFAITSSVVLIAAGLGVGAVWVRSLTVYMVRQRTLHTYRYLEHGAHYTVAVLATTLLLGVIVNVPEVVAGVSGVIFVTAAFISSRRAIVDTT